MFSSAQASQAGAGASLRARTGGLLRSWFHEITTVDQISDWFIELQVLSSQADRLCEVVAAVAGAEFHALRRSRVPEEVLFADAGNAGRMELMMRGDLSGNAGIYHLIQINGGTLILERGYSGYEREGSVTRAEGRVLRAVLDALLVTGWCVGYGLGRGPEAREEIARGCTGPSLREYLRI